MKKIILSTLCLFIASIASNMYGQTLDIKSSDFYQIEDGLHNKALVGGDTYNGSVYHQDAKNRDNAKWQFKSAGDGYYYIVDVKHNKVLVAGDVANNRVYHQDSQGRDNAKWKLEPVGDGTFHITDKKHNKSLIAGTNYDGNVYHQAPQGRKNATWKLTVVGTGTGTASTPPVVSTPDIKSSDFYQIEDGLHNKALVGGDTYNGSVYHQDAKNRDNAKWQFKSAGDGYYYIVDVKHNKVLVAGDVANNRVYHQDPQERDNAKWKLEPVGDGTFHITDKKHNKSLIAGTSYDGNVYHQAPQGRKNATWKLTVVGTGTEAGKQTNIALNKPASKTWNFKSGSNLPLELSANGKVIDTLKLYGKTLSLPVGIGDVVTVKVIEENQDANRNKLGYPPITINDGTENPLTITVKPAYTHDDQRTGLRDDYIVNFRGVDLTKFEPFNVGGSFTGRKIFDGLRVGTYMYEQLDDGAYVPTGFTNTGKINSGSGKYEEKTIIGKDKMKEAWSVGAVAGATIPLDKAGKFGGKGTVAFNYGESKVENSSESDVFIASSERKVIYNLEIENLDRVILTLDFIQAVESIESIADAHQVVKRYGTHYADKVNYGGEYHTMIRIHEDAYYTANSQNWDLTTDIKVDKLGGPKTTTRKPNNNYDPDEGYTDTESGGTDTGLVGGSFSFKHEKDQSHEEVYGNIESEYWFRGGAGNGERWSADANNSVAVQVGNLIYISELVKPNIFKTELTESELKPKRDLLKQAIDLKLKNMKYLELPKPYRTFHYRIKSIDYVHYNDDANTRIKGKISAQVISGGKTNWTVGGKQVGIQTLWERTDWSEENIGGLTDRQGLNLKRNSSDRNSWVEGKQEGIYVGTNEDAKMKFEPLQIKFEGSITEKDDCCFNTGHDVLNIKGDQVMTIADSDKRQYFTFILDHFFTHVEKMRLKVTIEVVPLIGF